MSSLAVAYALKKKKYKPEVGEPTQKENYEEPAHDRLDMREMGKQRSYEAMDKRERAMLAFGGSAIHKEETADYNPPQVPPRKLQVEAHMEDEHELGQHGSHEEGEQGGYVDAEDHKRLVEHEVENQGPVKDMVGTIMKQRQQVFAHGGKVKHKETGHEKGVHHQASHGERGQSYAGAMSSKKSSAENDNFFKGLSKEEHEKVLRDLKGSPNPALPMAEGGEAHMCSGSNCGHYSHGGMAGYSEGGRIANTDEEITGEMPNEFDDLHLDDHLGDGGKADYTGANSGDEVGNKQKDHDEEDLITRIMKSRAKKDRMPHPA